jgi:threonine aldolase
MQHFASDNYAGFCPEALRSAATSRFTWCAWDTQPEMIKRFAAELRELDGA